MQHVGEDSDIKESLKLKRGILTMLACSPHDSVIIILITANSLENLLQIIIIFVACVQPPLPSKEIGEGRLWFAIDNRVQSSRDFFRNVWKMIWLVISLTSLYHLSSEIWLAFIFTGFAIGAFSSESFTFVRDMWDFDYEFARVLWLRHRKKYR